MFNYFETPYKFSAQNATKEIRKQFQRLPPSLHSINQRLIQQKGSKRKKKRKECERKGAFYIQKKNVATTLCLKTQTAFDEIGFGKKKKDFIDSTQCIQQKNLGEILSFPPE